MNPPTIWEYLRDWLGLAFSGATALFAGLVWWLARKSFEPQIDVVIRQRAGNQLFGELRVTNAGRSPLLIDEVEGLTPSGVQIWSRAEVSQSVPMLSQRRDFHPGVPLMTVLSGTTSVFDVQLLLPDSRMELSSVRISCHMTKRWRTMRHRKKLITAILAERIRKPQD